MTEQELGFLLNYFGDRDYKHITHERVKERFPQLDKILNILINEGYITKGDTKYLLSEQARRIRINYRKTEKSRSKAAKDKIMKLALQGDYLGAYNARAEYEYNCILPHGITLSLGGYNNMWRYSNRTPDYINNYIKIANCLNLNDNLNSERFNLFFRRFFIGYNITGADISAINDDISSFEDIVNEKLNCPALDTLLSEKCKFPHIPKFYIYFLSKIRESTGLNQFGEYTLGIYDCTIPFHAAIAEYEIMKQYNIPKFPKTFNTFWRHKQKNNEKYQEWKKQTPSG